MNLKGKGKPQNYVLFGASTGDIITGENLSTFELCDFIVEVGRKNPHGIHVGFAFTYDMNMIVKSLHPRNLAYLHRRGYLTLTSVKTGSRYCLIMRKGKWFSVTRYLASYSRSNPMAKTTVRIYDIFSFFACSFVKAVEEMLGPDTPGLDIIREGKKKRREFTFDELGYVQKYWTEEIRVLALLTEELRRRFYAGGFKISQWHGPGALASYAMQQHGIKKHMAISPDPVREATRYAFAAGRFEMPQLGRRLGPVYGIDRNSAYPFAITQLPSLSEGEWKHVDRPSSINYFGVYHVKLDRSAGFDKAAAPLFHRDSQHNISYPWVLEGWYWSPEVIGLIGKKNIEIIEGWEYTGWRTNPFAFFNEWYIERQERKRKGDPSQLGFKLGMNSAYGKMAQRVGWDPVKNRVPPWHQLEWAGWVTSHCRAAMYKLMLRIPQRNLLAVETDGVYTDIHPSQIGVQEGKGLGDWEVTEWEEVMYVQSGLAWLRTSVPSATHRCTPEAECAPGRHWETKRRGLDPESFTRRQCEEYLKRLGAYEQWPSFHGVTTRFIGLGAALASSQAVKSKHCVWETKTRDIVPGEHGKRVHVPRYCTACKQNASAYEMTHDLVIRSKSRAGEMSTPHIIPWEGNDSGATEEWREREISEGDVLHDD